MSEALPVAHIGCIHHAERGKPLPPKWQPCQDLTVDDKTTRSLEATRRRKATLKSGSQS